MYKVLQIDHALTLSAEMSFRKRAIFADAITKSGKPATQSIASLGIASPRPTAEHNDTVGTHMVMTVKFARSSKHGL